MLDRYRVLDLTDDRGTFCGKIMAEFSADREQFQYLVELVLSEKRLPTTTSAKSRSKKMRWI